MDAPFDTKLFTKYGSVIVATAYYMSNEHPACSRAGARRIEEITQGSAAEFRVPL